MLVAFHKQDAHPNEPTQHVPKERRFDKVVVLRHHDLAQRLCVREEDPLRVEDGRVAYQPIVRYAVDPFSLRIARRFPNHRDEVTPEEVTALHTINELCLPTLGGPILTGGCGKCRSGLRSLGQMIMTHVPCMTILTVTMARKVQKYEVCMEQLGASLTRSAEMMAEVRRMALAPLACAHRLAADILPLVGKESEGEDISYL